MNTSTSCLPRAAPSYVHPLIETSCMGMGLFSMMASRSGSAALISAAMDPRAFPMLVSASTLTMRRFSRMATNSSQPRNRTALA